MTRRSEIQNLIVKNQRRLQKLKEKKATLGVNTHPEILTEIEDVEAEIEELQTELGDFPHTSSSLLQQNFSSKSGGQPESKRPVSCLSGPIFIITLSCVLGLCALVGIFSFSSWFSGIAKSVELQENQLPDTTVIIQSEPTPSPSPVYTPTPTVSPSPTIDTNLLFADDFNEGLKPEWQEDYGKWKMVNGRLVSVEYVDESARIFVGDSGWHNYSISLETGTFTSNFIKGNAVSVLARVQDSSNYIWFFVNYSYVICAIKQDGNDTILSEKRDTSFNPIEKGDHRFLVKVEGTRYEFVLDDKQICFFEDDTFLNGKVGLWAKPDMNDNNPWIDNFRVTELP